MNIPYEDYTPGQDIARNKARAGFGPKIDIMGRGTNDPSFGISPTAGLRNFDAEPVIKNVKKILVKASQKRSSKR